MMITIYGLPVTIKYQDLKVLIKKECNIEDFILDYLVSDGEGGKKVRVGLADDAEGSQLMKCLNGYRLSGHVLRLVPVGKSTPINSQQQIYTPRGNFSRNDYPVQNEHAVKPIETRPTPWSTNPQWTATPVAAVNSYNYQQPQTINTTYVQPQAAQAKQQFEAREVATVNRVQTHSHTTSYSYPSKSNLISLGPHRNVSTVPVHEIPESSNRMQSSRYPQSYEAPEKPITMMKDHFQGPQYSNTQTGSYQSQTLPWTGQQQQKTYEKQSPVFEKKYDDRKYPLIQTKTDVTKDNFKAEYARYCDDRKQLSPGRRTSSDRHIDRQPDRMSVRNVDRQLDRLTDRHIDRPNDRYIDRPADRHVDRQTDRHIDRPTDRHIDRPTDRHNDRPTDRHIERQTDRYIDRPSDRHIEQTSDRHMDRQTDRHSSGMQRISPIRHIAVRKVSPVMSRMDRHSPATHTERRYSPSRQVAQSPIRKISPHRKISPSGRKDEYVRGRRLSPPSHSGMNRHSSRQSPSRVRHDSPTRPGARYSPRHDKPREYEDLRPAKDVRPAYESQASKEAMYSGGYRPNVHVDVQYQRKDWQDREKQFPSKNIPEDRRDVTRMQKFDIPRASDPQRIIEDEKKRSRSRTSRSPRRSPGRDRFRRHSPSPRSPRRSWALEKRRSPETREPPPPPTWPGQDGRQQDYQQQRSKFLERIEKKAPVWEVPSQDKKSDDFSKSDRRNFEDQRVRTDVPKWKLPEASSKEASRFVDDSRFQKEAKYSRKDFEERHALSREDDERKSYAEKRYKDFPRSERGEARYNSNLSQKDIIIKKHEEYAGTIEEKKKEILHKQEQLQKEIEEVYKRAVDFTKKAEMFKKGELKKEIQYKDDRRDEKEYEERHKYSYEDDRHGREDYRKEFVKPYSKADESKFGSFGKSRDSEDFERKFGANAAIKIKRIKAMDEISEKILNQYASDTSSEIKKRISEELKLSIGKILVGMFGDKDVSLIEMLVKFNARHTQKDEERIFEDVMSCLPSHYRTIKRPSKGESEISAKLSRRSAEPNIKKDQQSILNKQIKPSNCKSEAVRGSNEPLVKKRPVEASSKYEDEKKAKVLKITKQEEIKPVSQEVRTTERKMETVKQEIKIPKEKLKHQEENKVQEDGPLQLNQLLTRALEEELHDVLVQIWKTLPDVGSSDVERFVTERLREGASEELKKVLGLNVTKRLLNVFNPFFVKIQFSGRPENGFLTKFLQTYNITSFKRINQDSNTFAAKLNTITDFDNICTAKDLRCGSARLSVTPCYKFAKCPDNLNSMYANKPEYEFHTNNETSDKITNENNLSVTDNSSRNVKSEIHDKKEVPEKAKQEVTSKIQTKQKAQENIKAVKKDIKTDKTKDNKRTLKEIQYEKEMFDDINEMDPEFNEEMNDDEILALISRGVVVDQCSGSDQE